METDPRRIGLVRSVDVGINGDCKLAAIDLLSRLRSMSDVTCLATIQERLSKLAQVRETWENTLDDMTENMERARDGKILPRQALRELERAMPKNAMVSTDIGNVCSVSNGYLRFNRYNFNQMAKSEFLIVCHVSRLKFLVDLE